MSEASGEDEDDAARAFEALREEVAKLRHGVELVYRQGQEAKSADYSLTLGSMAKTLQAVQGRLEAIEDKPALAMTPEVYRERIEEMGHFAGQAAGRALSDGAAAQSQATRELREVTSQARAVREQRWWMITIGALGIIVGLGLWSILVAVLPRGGGTWLAALPLAAGERWQAGQVLLQAADPAGFARIVKLSQACGNQQVEYCAATIAVKTAGSHQHENRSPVGATAGGTR